MRKRRSEFKSEKAKLEEKINTLQAQVSAQKAPAPEAPS
jgi:hypothetical protein